MATQIFAVTATPADIVAGLSLADGTTHSAQNVSGVHIKVLEAATAPDAEDAALLVRPEATFTIVPASGEQVYVWSTGTDGTVVVNEVA